MRIIFFGTPEFAVTSLKAMLDHRLNVVAVVTAPDKPAGRGMQLRPSPVKAFALSNQLPVLQPTNLKDPIFLETLRGYQADLQVVIAFRMLPEAVWNMPPKGTMNLHASLLPDYRGAAPINWAIINGEQETGVSTFLLKHEIDTGDLIATASCKIGENMNAGELHDQLMHLGATLVIESIQMIEDGSIKPIPQPISLQQKVAPKIFTEDCQINWDNQIENVQHLILGLSPYPGAFTQIPGGKLKIFSALIHPEEKMQSLPGVMKIIEGSKLLFACKNGWIEVTEVQFEGKKRMKTLDFLNGYRNS